MSNSRLKFRQWEEEQMTETRTIHPKPSKAEIEAIEKEYKKKGYALTGTQYTADRDGKPATFTLFFDPKLKEKPKAWSYRNERKDKKKKGSRAQWTEYAKNKGV